MTRDELLDKIAAARHSRYCDEMSDDYCYSNGTYDRHTKYINELESQLADMCAISLDKFTWDKTQRRLYASINSIATAWAAWQHTYPRDILVKSHHTGKVVQFVSVNQDHPLFDEDGWDGEMMVYSVVKTNGITTPYDDIVLVLIAN